MLLDWVIEICEEYLTITEEDSHQINAVLRERRPKLTVDARALRKRILPFLRQVWHYAGQSDDYELRQQINTTIT